MTNYITISTCQTLMFLRNFTGINKKSALNISIIGGSNSVIRRGYAKYLDNYISKVVSRPTLLQYYSLGGVPSIYGTIQQERHNIASNSDLIFFEYCVNDRHAINVQQYSLNLAGKSLEGLVRKVKQSNPHCLIVILIFGINLDDFYQNHCYLSELYESVGNHYGLPVINITKLLTGERSLDYVKSLYHEKDHAHYSRPEGVQVVSRLIVDQLEKVGIVELLKSNSTFGNKHQKSLSAYSSIYPDNFEQLSFCEDFEPGNFFATQPKVSVYQNTVFREKNLTIYQGNSLNFWLKGRLMALLIKSDLSDGFIKIQFDEQTVVTSSYSSWVNKIKPQNVINLITLPLRQFSVSQDFAPVSISLCPEYPDDFELDFNKIASPKQDPQKWKLSIIGFAYIGEIKTVRSE